MTTAGRVFPALAFVSSHASHAAALVKARMGRAVAGFVGIRAGIEGVMVV